MLWFALAAAVGAAGAPGGIGAQWGRVLSEYARGNVTIYDNAGTRELSTSEFVRSPRICGAIIYTAHDASRIVDRTLDEFRTSWANEIKGVCNFRINVDIPLEVSGASMPPAPELSWRKRTRNNPIILTDRYRAGLLLMAMIKKGLIISPSGGEPWILYVDGDIAMVNVNTTIRTLVERVERVTSRATMEERLAGVTRSNDTERHVDVVFTHGDCMMLNSFSQSGSILFRASGLSGFLFELLGQSPYYSVNVNDYRMGDQAIIDWVTEQAFKMPWQKHNELCGNYTHFEPGCDGEEFSYARAISPTVPDHYFLQRYYRTWAPFIGEDHYIAWACGRWFNSAICKIRFREGSPFYFRCGDLLWHVYGCSKLERLYSKELKALMTSPQCLAGLPPAAQEFFGSS